VTLYINNVQSTKNIVCKSQKNYESGKIKFNQEQFAPKGASRKPIGEKNYFDAGFG
jgi:hypothetical protein